MATRISVLTDSEFLQRGELTNATVLIELDEPLKRVRNITAEFHAAERSEAQYTTTKTNAKGQMETETKTAVEFYDIVKESFLLQGEPPQGCWRGLMDSLAAIVGGGSGRVLDAGKHEFPISFTIPKDAPASMEGDKCSVFYNVSVRVDRSLALDPRELRTLTVTPLSQAESEPQPVIAHYPDANGRGFWDRTFGKDARLALVINNDTFVAGDQLDGLITAETETPIKIRKATARLLCVETTQAQGHSDSATHASKPIVIAERQDVYADFAARFTLPLESIGPPTTLATNFSVDWFVEVALDVPWAKDPTIQAPIRVFPS